MSTCLNATLSCQYTRNTVASENRYNNIKSRSLIILHSDVITRYLALINSYLNIYIVNFRMSTYKYPACQDTVYITRMLIFKKVFQYTMNYVTYWR